MIILLHDEESRGYLLEEDEVKEWLEDGSIQDGDKLYRAELYATAKQTRTMSLIFTKENQDEH